MNQIILDILRLNFTGKTSVEFPFNEEIEITLRARLRQARLAKVESDKEQLNIHSKPDSEQEKDPEIEVETMVEYPLPPEILLGDYGMTNASGGGISSLPSETVQNPRNHENTNVVTTRIKKDAKDEKVIPPGKPTEEKNKKETKHVIRLPYPLRATKKEPRETYFEKFMTMFKKIESHMPFFEALERIPMYKKFMEEVIAEKRPTREGSVAWKEKCSAISLGKRIPNKQKDPGAITVTRIIKERTFKKVLIDYGASVSLMPLSIYHRLGIKNISDTRTNLTFAGHSIKNAYGITEDVLVGIGELSFPVDLVIIDIPKDEETPIILGRTFMQTS
ncbi:uncharacterized protein LOC127137101 [Lathyrus oleraceus]|uniref:uncharacterized protein LOC127137101 n=1 Tax=Pisum sativum TaxID=3888 RepID=UPI0021D11FAB|nr:uncharacterized protein LOC127137101 [Pisum sativum]